jgi:hypothetical protein
MNEKKEKRLPLHRPHCSKAGGCDGQSFVFNDIQYDCPIARGTFSCPHVWEAANLKKEK